MSGPELLRQEVPSLPRPPATIEWPQMGQSAERLWDSGEIWAKPGEVEEEVDGFVLGEMRSDAEGRPLEEGVEADRWQWGLTSDLMMKTNWWQNKKKELENHIWFVTECWEWSLF